MGSLDACVLLLSPSAVPEVDRQPRGRDESGRLLPSGDPRHRRWLKAQNLAALYGASQGEERVLVVLEGYNALRCGKVRRLRIRDVDLMAKRLRVHGKGRHSGKWRTIPMAATTAAAIADWVQGRRADEFVLPGTKVGTALSESVCDSRIRQTVERAGLIYRGVGVSNHDLRRTFGRVAYYVGMSLVDLRNFYGHKSIDMSAHYIGLDEDQMREGLAGFDARMAGLRWRARGCVLPDLYPPPTPSVPGPLVVSTGPARAAFT